MTASPRPPLLCIGNICSSLVGSFLATWSRTDVQCPDCRPSVACSAVTCPACHCACGEAAAPGIAAAASAAPSSWLLWTLGACAVSAGVAALLVWLRLRVAVQHRFATVGEISVGPTSGTLGSRSGSVSLPGTPVSEATRVAPGSPLSALTLGAADIAVWQPRRRS